MSGPIREARSPGAEERAYPRRRLLLNAKCETILVSDDRCLVCRRHVSAYALNLAARSRRLPAQRIRSNVIENSGDVRHRYFPPRSSITP
jgi:hypothetical protein